MSVISSGDESGAKEYIHPRAGLVGALGKCSRGTVERPLIYVTEMVAFFKKLGRVKVHGYTGGGRRSMETVTNRSGQFFFERVPPGRYDLAFLTAKDDRRVYALPVVIERVPKFRLPDIHIPLDSIRPRAAARY